MKKHKLLLSRKIKKEPLDLDITSLLDILTIILVFLLFSYNPSELKIDLVDKINLAESFSKRFTQLAPVIQINQDLRVFYDSNDIGVLNGENAIETLKKLLEKEKRKLENSHALKGKNKNDYLINLVFDKSTNSKYVDLVMKEAAQVGFTKFKFIVKSK